MFSSRVSFRGGALNRIESLLRIEEKSARQKALLGYARLLKINVSRAEKRNGEIDEDVLTVLIHDAERSRSTRRTVNTGFIAGALFVAAVALAVIFLLVRLMDLSSRGEGLNGLPPAVGGLIGLYSGRG